MFENFISEKEAIDRFNLNPILFYNLKHKYSLEFNCHGEIDIFDLNFNQMVEDLKVIQGKNIVDYKENIIYMISEIAKYNITDFFNVLNIDPFVVISYYNKNIDHYPYKTTYNHIEQQRAVLDHIQLNILHTILIFKEQMDGNKDIEATVYDCDIEMVFSLFREETFNVINKSSRSAILKCFSEIKNEFDRVNNEYLKHLELIYK